MRLLAEAGGRDPPEEDSNFCFLELTPIESLFESISWSAGSAWPPFLLPFLLEDGLEATTPARAMLGCNRVRVVTKLFSTPRNKS